MPGTLLATKLYIPAPRPELVARPRLVERLEQGLGRKLTLVSAPAGYGKTTLLSAWIASYGQARQGDATTPGFGWLSLDEGDNDLARFLAYWIAALNMADPSSDRAAAQALTTSTLLSAEPVMTALINDLVARPSQIVLILDDYHLISEPAIHQALAFWLDHQPPGAHLVISGRADPPLPAARLRARGELAELHQDDLCFSQAEAAEFLSKVTGLTLSARDVAALASRTEGWIAGLQLAAASMQGRADPAAFVQSFTGSNRFILDYLLAEVLERQPPAIQAFLLQTSILERLCGSLCDAVIGEQVQAGAAVLGAEDSRQILDRLERANLFLLPLDAERRWYRYHQLFADLLRKQLGHTWPALAPELHRRASAWFEANDLPIQAIDHALEADDMDRAVLMIEAVAEDTLLRGEVTTLMNWMERLPQELLFSRPTLCLYQSWVLLLTGQPLESLETYAHKLADRSDISPGELAALNAVMAVARDDMHATALYSQQALEWLPKEDLFVRGIAARLLGMARLVDGDQAESEQILDEIVRRSQQSGHIANAVSSLCYMAELALRRAQLRRARVFYERAVALVVDHQGHPHPMTCEALLGLGALARETNDFANAERLLKQGIELALQWRPIEAIGGYGDLARIRQAQGDFSAADEILFTARSLARQIDYIQVDDLAVEMQQARLWVAGGNLRAAWEWAIQRELDRPDDEIAPAPYQDPISARMRKYEQMVMARLLLASGQPAQALNMLEELRRRLEAIGRIAMVMESHLLEALAHQALNNLAPAQASLERALAFAEPEGYIRLFADEGAPMANLLGRKLKDASGTMKDYLTRLLAACGEAGAPASARTAPLLTNPLTERELEVLRLLSTSLPTSEIAGCLYIADSTLRSHTKSIYAKLNAHSRLEAVQRAVELGILPP